MKRASLIARFFAFVIDLVFLFFITALVTGSIFAGYSIGAGRVPSRDPVGAVLTAILVFILSGIVLFLFYFTYLTSGKGRTIGKNVFGIKVVRAKDEGEVGWGRALARTCTYVLSAFPFLLGFIMAFLFGGRALHDILTGTRVAREE
jgi:uncharacterized RDD family membrane protein YckC